MNRSASHRRTAWAVGGVSAGMFVLAFAVAPFYGAICEALGIQNAGTISRNFGPPSAEPTVRPVTMRFATTVNGNLPWDFEAVEHRADIETGRLYTATFRVRNNSDQPLTGRAVPSVSPWQATPYLDKTECFCFSEQPLAPGETAELALRYAVLPDLPTQFDALTLSYTFMNIDPDAIAMPEQAQQADNHDHDHAHGT